MQDRPEATGAELARDERGAADEPRAAGGPQGANVSGHGGAALAGRRPRRHRRGGEQRGPQRGGEREGYTGRPEPSLNMDELRELADLIVSQGFTEFELEREGFRVRLSRNTTPAVPHAVAAGASLPPVTLAPPAFGAGEQTAATGSAPAEPPAPAPELKPEAGAATAEEDLHKITSPIVGTFYRSPSPAAEPFVRVGTRVGPDTVVCIIEAMKLMNEILAEVSGTVEKIYVENGQPVEYGQPLFGIKK